MNDSIVVDYGAIIDLDKIGLKGATVYKELNPRKNGNHVIRMTKLVRESIESHHMNSFWRKAEMYSGIGPGILFDLRMAVTFVDWANRNKVTPPPEMENGVNLGFGTILQVGASFAVPGVYKNGIWRVRCEKMGNGSNEPLFWCHIDQ